METTGKSRIMFVLADPVDHVRASAIINAHFAGRGIDLAAVPLNVRPDDLAAVVDAIRLMRNVAGFGVTIPHKVAIIPLLDEVSAKARMIGAVNFVRRTADGRLVGDNMDAPGFIAGVRAKGFEPRGKRVLQLGAGGAGRATAFALAQAGVAELWIANRDSAKARDLASAISAHFPEVRIVADTAPAESFELVVNTTPLGMKAGDALPTDIGGVGPSTLVYDIIVNPTVTPIMAQAQAQGALTIGGKAMLDAQMSLVEAFISH